MLTLKLTQGSKDLGEQLPTLLEAGPSIRLPLVLLWSREAGLKWSVPVLFPRRGMS